MKLLSQQSRRRLARADRRGNLLMVSIAFVLVVAGMGMVMLQVHTAQSRRQLQATDNKRALYIAEAGLAEAFVAISQGKTGNVGSEALPAVYADGIYWVVATPGNKDEIGLVSTGLCGTGRFALSMVLKRQVDPISSFGFFANQDVVIGKDAIVDGYNSKRAPLSAFIDPALPGNTTGMGARVSAGGDIILDGLSGPQGSGTMLYGDAQPGPNGVVSQAPDVTVTGATAPLRQATVLPQVTPPAVPAVDAWPLGLGGGTLPRGRSQFLSGGVAGGRVLRIEGPALLVFDELLIKSGGTLQIDSTNGQVVIFVQEYLELQNGSMIENVTQDPTGLAIFANGTQFIDRNGDGIPDPPVVFGPTGEFYGYVYAPAADLQLAADLHLIGGVACNSLTVADNGHLTFDLALTSSEITVAGLPRLIAWRIVELPNAGLVKTRIDPFKELADLGVTPVKSALASTDTYIYVKYYDLAGVARAYSGLYSLFNWADVDSVIGMMWDDDAVIGDEGQEWTAPAAIVNTRVADAGVRALK